MIKNVLTYNLSEPLGCITTANINIHPGDGNLMIGGLTSGEQMLASGTLQYLQSQNLPTPSLNMNDGQATFTLHAGGRGQPWLRFPWSACNGATTWQIQLNPHVLFDITAHSDGGNVRLDLTGMAVTRVSADTGGGNIEVILPDNAAGASVAAKTGAGNVVVQIPGGMAARIHATSGLGRVIMSPSFKKIDGNTYQTPDYDSASDKVEITASSGAGNVSVTERITQAEAASIGAFQ